MNNNIFIENCINKINSLRKLEFEKNNICYEEKIIEKRKINENNIEFKKFQNNMIKKGLLDKNKPSNMNKKEYISTNTDINILQDDIFNNSNLENKETEFKLDLQLLDKDKKMELIQDYLQRKNIILDEKEFLKIENIIDDLEINIKKYFNISKIYQQINKISFIKKLENGSYIVDTSDNKKKKKFFNK